jgi:peptide/nickel transport system substrate-binding protein
MDAPRSEGVPGGGRVRSRAHAGPLARLSSVAVVVALGVGAGGTAAASAQAARGSAASVRGGFATYALPVGDDFSWILPLENAANYYAYEEGIGGTMWRPLYFAGTGSHTGIDYHLSIGKPPVYSNGDRTVTIDLNPGYSWSDGVKVTTTDVKFFFQLYGAGKATLGNYVPGEMPDDIASVSYPSPDEFVLHLKRAYNPTWFTGNQLTWIYPLPAQAWDRTCATCAAGSAAATPAGAKAVFKFLFSQSKSLATYATNPLWKTVDGPFVLSAFNPVTYAATFSRNTKYTGPTPPHLAGYRILSFTTGTAELDALRSGSITFGYLPFGSLGEASYFESHGYTVKPWHVFAQGAVELNFSSTTWGPLVKQLYIRQALQHLVNEQLYISRTLNGYGLPTYGPVEDYPGSDYVSPTLRKDPYPYDPAAATSLLAEHGWVAGAGGVDVCGRAGTGAHDCGPGIPKGKALSFLFLYETGTTSFFEQVSAFQSAAHKVGIGMTLDGQTLTTMDSIAGVCPSSPCNWGLVGYSLYYWGFGQYTLVPTASGEFAKGNYYGGGYDSPTAQRLIRATRDVAGLRSLYADENFLSKDVPALWWPAADNQIVVVKDGLGGWQHLNPYQNDLPEMWYFKR